MENMLPQEQHLATSNFFVKFVTFYYVHMCYFMTLTQF